MMDKACTRIAILGCGYVGSALAKALTEKGQDVVATTTTPARLSELWALGAKPFVVELSEVARLHKMLSDRQTVFLTVGAGRGKRDYREVYLNGVNYVFEAVDGTDVTRIIYTSSTSVYGQNNGGWVDERSPTEPTSENGRVLLLAERALLSGAAQRGMTATVLRLGGIYGPGRDPAERISRHADSDRADGDVYVNLIHLDDIVTAAIRLLEVSYHGILNLVDDQPTRRRDYYDQLIAAADLAPIRWVSGDAPNVCGKKVCNDLLKATLNLSLQHPTHG